MEEIVVRRLDRLDLDQALMMGDALSFLKEDYPGFRYWYKQKVIPQFIQGNRSIYLVTPQNDRSRIAGAMILKNTFNQKKICTLYVDKDFCNKGIGTALVTEAIKNLNEDHPLITVSANHVATLDSFLRHFGFDLYDSYSDYYCVGVNEYSYNGPIEPEECEDKSIIFYSMPRCIAKKSLL